MNNIPLRSINYQWEKNLYKSPQQLKRRYEYKQKFGYKIISRNQDQTSKEIEFNIYVPQLNKDEKYYLIHNKTNWKAQEEYEFKIKKTLLNKEDNNFLSITTTQLKHKDEYLILKITDSSSKEKTILRDPASTFFSEKGNSIVWDFNDPNSYKQKYPSPNTLHRTNKILQTDLPGLINKWPTYDPNKHPEQKDIYNFIIKCKVLDKIKELGFNTIQFLPISQSIDGDNWKFRYLSPFPFALQKNWGNPDSFNKLVDECHKRGIAVILDIILSHAPYEKFKLFNIKGEDVGIHTWTTTERRTLISDQSITQDIFLDEKTTWGTKRFRYQDPNINQYLIESAQHFLTKYNIDGFRIDNVDGILRQGPHGQGEPREGGLSLLRNLIKEMYKLNPLAIINLESHYFYENNAHLLVAPQEENEKALGATAYNSSRLTYYLHTELMPKSVDDINIFKFDEINKEKEKTKSNSTIADFHNHDAAANLMESRATGSYAYDALILNNPQLREHAIGKIKTMQALIAFGTEGRILDLLQSYNFQRGTFDHDSSIHWDLILNKKNQLDENKNELLSFKKKINKILDEPAFWPENTINRQFINIDNNNKILCIKRKDSTQGTNKEFIIIINFSNKEFENYKIKNNSKEIIIPKINSYDVLILKN